MQGENAGVPLNYSMTAEDVLVKILPRNLSMNSKFNNDRVSGEFEIRSFNVSECDDDARVGGRKGGECSLIHTPYKVRVRE